MSLINKMLQDLDARGSQPGAGAVSPEIRTVLAPERGVPWLRVALLGGLVAVLGASGYVAWRVQQGGALAGAAIVAAPADPQPVVAVTEPLAAISPAPPAPAAMAEPEPEPIAEPIAVPDAAPPEPEAALPVPVKKPAPARQRAPNSGAPPKTPAAGADPTARAAGGRVETSSQGAENGYRRALASLEQGRVSEAIGQLQGALRADPRHEASRQTLVSLLIEAKRPDEAAQQLQAALALDPRQPALAMLLARLQIENGGPGIETLQRSLPHAGGNGGYHAFLAGALQRELRHREAAEHYQAALRTAPQNGVWWMGLGISLQAEDRAAEAAVAYARARDSGALSPELLGFVDRKLEQLAR